MLVAHPPENRDVLHHRWRRRPGDHRHDLHAGSVSTTSQPVVTSSSRVGHQAQAYDSRLQRCPTPTGSPPGFLLAGDPAGHGQPLRHGLMLVVLHPPMVNLRQPVIVAVAVRPL